MQCPRTCSYNCHRHSAAIDIVAATSRNALEAAPARQAQTRSHLLARPRAHTHTHPHTHTPLRIRTRSGVETTCSAKRPALCDPRRSGPHARSPQRIGAPPPPVHKDAHSTHRREYNRVTKIHPRCTRCVCVYVRACVCIGAGQAFDG